MAWVSSFTLYLVLLLQMPDSSIGFLIELVLFVSQ
jgi:hypothetical protein